MGLVAWLILLAVSAALQMVYPRGRRRNGDPRRPPLKAEAGSYPLRWLAVRHTGFAKRGDRP
jgi:hypothetical protein